MKKNKQDILAGSRENWHKNGAQIRVKIQERRRYLVLGQLLSRRAMPAAAAATPHYPRAARKMMYPTHYYIFVVAE